MDREATVILTGENRAANQPGSFWQNKVQGMSWSLTTSGTAWLEPTWPGTGGSEACSRDRHGWQPADLAPLAPDPFHARSAAGGGLHRCRVSAHLP